VFLALPGIVDEDNQERYRLWRLYVEIMVNPGHKRNDPMNGFWGELGIAPRDFDWEDWRDAMGYSKY
jgi:ABC-type nitrate/sulfonate/bicarbonate transport system substrate-binding protein